MTGSEGALIALGDQVQALVEAAPVQVIAFVLVLAEGGVEYRSPLTIEQLRVVLSRVSSEL